MDYGLFLKIANTGNNLNGNCACPIQAAVKLLKFSTELTIPQLFETTAYTFNELIMPDELVLDYSAIYCGISNKRLEKDHPRPVAEVIPGLFEMISKCNNKNIYICGWDILEDDLRILEKTMNRLSLKHFDFNSLRVIDVKKLSELLLPINELGAYGIDAVTYHLSKDKNIEFEILESYRSKRFYKEFSESLINQSVYVCWKLAKKEGFKNLDDIYTFMQKPHNLDVLPFGKYKGQKIEDVATKDREYLIWLFSCKDIMSKNKDLKYTLKCFFKIVQ